MFTLRTKISVFSAYFRFFDCGDDELLAKAKNTETQVSTCLEQVFSGAHSETIPGPPLLKLLHDGLRALTLLYSRAI